MRRVALDGYDLTLDGHIGLNLFRDGRRPAIQGGRWGPSESMRNPAGVEQSVILDRLDGGVGAVERLVPHTYPLAIDGCTRFSRAWTPSGQILDLPALENHASGREAGRIRALARLNNQVIAGAGNVIYRVRWPFVVLGEAIAKLQDDDEVQDFLVFHGYLIIGTRTPIGLPGRLYVWDGSLLHYSGDGHTGGGLTHGGASRPPCNRQHLVKTYMTINDVGASRIIGNDTPYTFRFVALDDPTASSVDTLDVILDDTTWQGYNSVTGVHNYPVGDYTAPITNMAASPLVMFFCKEDGVYHVGPDGRAACIADWSDSQHPSNGEVFEFAYGGLYASNFRWGLVRIDVANLQVQWQTNSCGPGANLPRVLPSTGQVTAFCMDGEWMVTSVFNGQDSYLFYGRPVEITERTAMINIQSPQALNWHGSEGTFYRKRITAIHQVTLLDDRPLLWVAWERAGPPHVEPHIYDPEFRAYGISYISLPKSGTPLEDWLMGGPHRFQTESWLYYPRQDWGDERGSGPYAGWSSVRKVFNRLDLTGEYLWRYHAWVDAYMASTGGEGVSGGHLLFWDRALEDEVSLWTHVGRFDEGERMSFVPGKAVQSGLKANLMLRGTCEPDHPFAIYGAKLRGTPLLEQNERRTYRVVIGRTRKANQAMDATMRLNQLNELWTLQWADPVELVDHYHLPMIVDIDPDMSYEDVTEPSTGEPTIVVTFSLRILRRPFIWGAGYRWGTGIAWS